MLLSIFNTYCTCFVPFLHDWICSPGREMLLFNCLVSLLRDSKPWAHAPKPLFPRVSNAQAHKKHLPLQWPAKQTRGESLTSVKEIVARHQQDRQRNNRRRPPPRRAPVPRLVLLGRLHGRHLLFCIDTRACRRRSGAARARDRAWRRRRRCSFCCWGRPWWLSRGRGGRGGGGEPALRGMGGSATCDGMHAAHGEQALL